MKCKDIMIDDFAFSERKGDLSVMHIVIGKPDNPKHYVTFGGELKDARQDMIDMLIEHLEKI